ncbi:MAG: hypothetical protein H6873_02135 [Hyphomicrobiaceae bacterium]|nr:hypothetical protein [Hyphomicrobiaceae bacterium]
MTRIFTFEILLPILAAMASTIVLSFVGIPEALGAHPFWAVKVGLYGAPAALIAWLVLRAFGVGAGPTLILSAVVLVAAALSAHFGKEIFAASYARNTLAGRFWYVGWITAMGAATTLLAAIIARLWPDRK